VAHVTEIFHNQLGGILQTMVNAVKAERTSEKSKSSKQSPSPEIDVNGSGSVRVFGANVHDVEDDNDGVVDDEDFKVDYNADVLEKNAYDDHVDDANSESSVTLSTRRARVGDPRSVSAIARASPTRVVDVLGGANAVATRGSSRISPVCVSVEGLKRAHSDDDDFDHHRSAKKVRK
jgi:hypothetical protein